MTARRIARRIARRVALPSLVTASVILAVTLISGHGAAVTPADDSSASSTGADAPSGHVVMALGDSVPAGSVCKCRPFPQIYGGLLGQQTGAPVTVDNRAVGGLTTPGLLAQLRKRAVQAAVRRSDVFLVEIGANDFNDHRRQVVRGRCETGHTDCVADELTTLHANLTAVLSKIRALRAGQPTTILVLGYWNVFKDGRVGRQAYGNAGSRATRALTRRVNAVISSVSAAKSATYVDIYGPFERDGRNLTALLAPDGNHPDAAGHRLIARTLLAAGLPRTS